MDTHDVHQCRGAALTSPHRQRVRAAYDAEVVPVDHPALSTKIGILQTHIREHGLGVARRVKHCLLTAPRDADGNSQFCFRYPSFFYGAFPHFSGLQP